jgi:hypothetical protein
MRPDKTRYHLHAGCSAKIWKNRGTADEENALQDSNYPLSRVVRGHYAIHRVAKAGIVGEIPEARGLWDELCCKVINIRTFEWRPAGCPETLPS